MTRYRSNKLAALEIIPGCLLRAIETPRKTRRVRVGKIHRTAGIHRHGADDGPGLEILRRLDFIRVADRAVHGQNELPGGRNAELYSGKPSLPHRVHPVVAGIPSPFGNTLLEP